MLDVIRVGPVLSPVDDLGADSPRTTFVVWAVLVLGRNSSSFESSVWDTDSEQSGIQNTRNLKFALDCDRNLQYILCNRWLSGRFPTRREKLKNTLALTGNMSFLHSYNFWNASKKKCYEAWFNFDIKYIGPISINIKSSDDISWRFLIPNIIEIGWIIFGIKHEDKFNLLILIFYIFPLMINLRAVDSTGFPPNYWAFAETSLRDGQTTNCPQCIMPLRVQSNLPAVLDGRFRAARVAYPVIC